MGRVHRTARRIARDEASVSFINDSDPGAVRRLSSTVAVRDRKPNQQRPSRDHGYTDTQTLGPESVSWQLFTSAWTSSSSSDLHNSGPSGHRYLEARARPPTANIGWCSSFESLLYFGIRNARRPRTVSDLNPTGVDLGDPPFLTIHGTAAHHCPSLLAGFSPESWPGHPHLYKG